MNNIVYWIRLPGHTDIYTQGYVGITNNFSKRMNHHKNKKSDTHFSRAIRLYGWDNLVKEVIREGLSTEEAYLIEASLRPTLNIGWNILAGGQAKQNGVKRSAATCKKIGDTHRGLVWTKEMIAKKPSASGPNNANFKGFIKCTNKATGDSFLVSSIKEMKDNGFTFGQVYNCLAGTRKTHKGFTFERIK